MDNNSHSGPSMTIRSDPLYVNIPADLSSRDPPPIYIPKYTKPAPRPLPVPPQTSNVDPPRPLRRRASGGSFLSIRPPVQKKQTFYVCNPSDSPISPNTPRAPDSALYPSQLALPTPINVIPATPLSPSMPGLVYSPASAVSPPLLTPMTNRSPPNAIPPSLKTRRRFGTSVTSIPQSVLADLRTVASPTRSSTLPVLGIPQSENDSDDDDPSSEFEEDEFEEEDLSFVVQTAKRVGLNASSRVSLGWIGESYSEILRAL
ncbi:hypothetical protein R3P38DRAFT_3166380 [Favolaschia claudopus]|uniref:Uncharacterized protein n=1 Tax=Favolaschia claudopus TaxID=2862362 RepID=A0AAW0EAU9_9AGAR